DAARLFRSGAGNVRSAPPLPMFRNLKPTVADSSSGAVSRSAHGRGAHEFALSNLSPSVDQRRLPLGVVRVLLVVFVIVAGPLSTLPIRRLDAFLPASGTTIFVTSIAARLIARFLHLDPWQIFAFYCGNGSKISKIAPCGLAEAADRRPP